MKNRNIIISIVVVLVVLGFLIFNQQRGGKSELPLSTKENSSNNLIPVAEITHGHGLAVDVAETSEQSSSARKLYIATHHGLLVLINDKDLYQVGRNKDDYMGFSTHPTNPQVFFTSGHPTFGGNLGFQKSEDGGVSWKKVSNGVNGPVDFHAMAVSPVNPDLIYGFYAGKLQRSSDGGKNWEAFKIEFSIISLIADPKDENVVFASNNQGLGIMVSRDKGESFEGLSEQLKGGVVTALAINQQDAKKMISFSEKMGLAKSGDGGITWEKVGESFSDEGAAFIAASKQNSNLVYALTFKNSLYKSIDGGDTWNKIR